MVLIVDKLIFARTVQFLSALVVVSGQQNYETGCPYPVPPDHAVLSAQSYLDEFNFNGFQAYQRVHFICRVGYRKTKGAMWSICGISGRWYPDTRQAGECSREIRTGEIECKGRFRCRKDLQCIDRKLRCDCNEDCRDGTDEIGCKNPKKMIFINPKSKKTAGIITSPNYPLGYPKTNFRCRFMFYASPSYRVEINFEEFSLRAPGKGQCLDYVRLTGIHRTYLEKLGGLRDSKSKDSKVQSVTRCGKEGFGNVISNNSRLEMSVSLSGVSSSKNPSNLRGYSLSWKVVSESAAKILIKRTIQTSSKQVSTAKDGEVTKDRSNSGSDLLTVLLPIAISALLPFSLVSFLCYHFRVRQGRITRDELNADGGKETGLFAEEAKSNKRIKRIKLTLDKRSGGNGVQSRGVSQEDDGSDELEDVRPVGDGLEKTRDTARDKTRDKGSTLHDATHGLQGKNCDGLSRVDEQTRLSFSKGGENVHGIAAVCPKLKICDDQSIDDVINDISRSKMEICSQLRIDGNRTGAVRYTGLKKHDYVEEHGRLLPGHESNRIPRRSFCGTREEIDRSIIDFRARENSKWNLDLGNQDCNVGISGYFYRGNQEQCNWGNKKSLSKHRRKCLETKSCVMSKVSLEDRGTVEDEFEKVCSSKLLEFDQMGLYSGTSTNGKYDTFDGREERTCLENGRARNARHRDKITSTCCDLPRDIKGRRSRSKKKHRRKPPLIGEEVVGDFVLDERPASFANGLEGRQAMSVAQRFSEDNPGVHGLTYDGAVDWVAEYRDEDSSLFRFEGSCRSNGSDSGTCTGSEFISPYVDNQFYGLAMPNGYVTNHYLRPNSYRRYGTASDTDSASKESAYTESVEGCAHGYCAEASQLYGYDGTLQGFGADVCSGTGCYYCSSMAGFNYSERTNNPYETCGRGYFESGVNQMAWIDRPIQQQQQHHHHLISESNSVVSTVPHEFERDPSIADDENGGKDSRFQYSDNAIVYNHRGIDIGHTGSDRAVDKDSLPRTVNIRRYAATHYGCGLSSTRCFDNSFDRSNDPSKDNDIENAMLS